MFFVLFCDLCDLLVRVGCLLFGCCLCFVCVYIWVFVVLVGVWRVVLVAVVVECLLWLFVFVFCLRFVFVFVELFGWLFVSSLLVLFEFACGGVCVFWFSMLFMLVCCLVDLVCCLYLDVSLVGWFMLVDSGCLCLLMFCDCISLFVCLFIGFWLYRICLTLMWLTYVNCLFVLFAVCWPNLWVF